MKHAAVLMLLLGCSELSPEEHCNQTCAFYSECDPAIAPLEAMCVSACTARLADPLQVTDECSVSTARHPIDQARGLPSLLDSIIDAGDCARQECPTGEDDRRCDGVEIVCLDTLTPEQRCLRLRQIANYRCSDGYQMCIAASRPQSTCSAEEAACYQSVNQQSCG